MSIILIFISLFFSQDHILHTYFTFLLNPFITFYPLQDIHHGLTHTIQVFVVDFFCGSPVVRVFLVMVLVSGARLQKSTTIGQTTNVCIACNEQGYVLQGIPILFNLVQTHL